MTQFMGTAEVAARLGVSRPRVRQLRATHADFPQPVAELAMGPVWRATQIERWASKHGKDETTR